MHFEFSLQVSMGQVGFWLLEHHQRVQIQMRIAHMRRIRRVCLTPPKYGAAPSSLDWANVTIPIVFSRCAYVPVAVP